MIDIEKGDEREAFLGTEEKRGEEKEKGKGAVKYKGNDSEVRKNKKKRANYAEVAKYKTTKRLDELERLLQRFETHRLQGRCRDLVTIMTGVRALLASREMREMLQTLLKLNKFSNSIFKAITSRLQLWVDGLIVTKCNIK